MWDNRNIILYKDFVSFLLAVGTDVIDGPQCGTMRTVREAGPYDVWLNAAPQKIFCVFSHNLYTRYLYFCGFIL